MSASQTFTTEQFQLESGSALPQLTVAYETYGRLKGDGGNAILLLHGYTSSQHAAGSDVRFGRAGWWNDLIGPGKAIDTDRFFVLCSNMLGSSYGTTGPRSRNPATGRPYGPEFPNITTGDMVAAQRALLGSLGIERLAAVIGYSFGGYLAFEWATRHPDMMRAVVPVATAIKRRGGQEMVDVLQQHFAAYPGWNGGDYYAAGQESIQEALTEWRIEVLRMYGAERKLQDSIADPAERARRLRQDAAIWAQDFDANSLIVLRRASLGYDAESRAERIRAPLLYVLANSDLRFPPDLAEPTMQRLEAAGVNARYFEIDSPYGHTAPASDAAKWAPTLEEFLDEHCA